MTNKNEIAGPHQSWCWKGILIIIIFQKGFNFFLFFLPSSVSWGGVWILYFSPPAQSQISFLYHTPSPGWPPPPTQRAVLLTSWGWVFNWPCLLQRQGRILLVFRFIIKYSSLRDFGPLVIIIIGLFFIWGLHLKYDNFGLCWNLWLVLELYIISWNILACVEIWDLF